MAAKKKAKRVESEQEQSEVVVISSEMTAEDKEVSVEGASEAFEGAEAEAPLQASGLPNPFAFRKHTRLNKLMASSMMAAIQKQHGKGIIASSSEHRSATVHFVPSGSFNLDWCLGGGYRVGGVHTLWGHKSSGKTTSMLLMIAQAQQLCGNCWGFAFFFDPKTGESYKTPKCPCGKYREVLIAYVNNEGCIAGSQEIYDPESGELMTVADFVAKPTAHVCAWTDGKLAVAPVETRTDSGVQETVIVRTPSTQLQCTPNHPILAWREGAPAWVAASELQAGDRIGRPWKVNIPGEDTGVTPEFAELLGYMLGDGSFNANSSLVFTNMDASIWSRVTRLAKKFGAKLERHDDRHGRLTTPGAQNPLRRRMKELGMLGTVAGSKHLPKEVLNAKEAVIVAALRGLWMTDGGVSISNAALHFTSTSRRLVVQAKWLLARLGILGHIYTQHDGNSDHQPWHILWVYGRDNLQAFHQKVKLYGHRGMQLAKWCKAPHSKPGREHYLPSYEPGNRKHTSNRATYRNTSDVWWDKVSEVVPGGKAQTFDAGVAAGHSWTVQDVVVHNSWDPNWARSLGVDPDGLLLSETEYAEQTLDIVEALFRDGEVDIVCIDSLAFLTPAKEIEESTTKEFMAIQPKVLGKGMRKFVSAANYMANHTDRRPTLFFTNQVRTKLNVMFGCFHEDTPVMFADGSQHRIADVVAQELKGPVLSWDGTRIVERNIISWYNNGPLQDQESWLTFRTEGTHGRRGAVGFTCTPNHILVTGEGQQVRAGDLHVGDTLLSWYEACLSETEREVVFGSMLGDGHITEGGALVLTNQEQPEYLQWKMSLLPSLGFYKQTSSADRVCWRSPNTFELRELVSTFYGSNQVRGLDYRTIPLDALGALGPLGYAIWFADDGTYKESHKSANISVKRLTDTHAHAVAAVVAKHYPGVSYNETQRALIFPTATFVQFSKDIAPYLPACIAYKLLPQHRDAAQQSPAIQHGSLRRVPRAVSILGIHASERKHRSRTKYDLQIEGNSFYLVGGDSCGVVVHNSPDMQPGGHAPQFAATTEVKFKSAKYQFDKDKEAADASDLNLNHTRANAVLFSFKVEKNKTGQAPWMEGSYLVAQTTIEGQLKGTVLEAAPIMEEAERLGLLTQQSKGWLFGDATFDTKKLIYENLMTNSIFRRQASKLLLTRLLNPVVATK